MEENKLKLPVKLVVSILIFDMIYLMKSLGKRYKNQICLQKHAWEHHQSWLYAKRLMLNKHQSVQIMEAAHILMNIVNSRRDDGELFEDQMIIVDEMDSILETVNNNDKCSGGAGPLSPTNEAEF